jgi:tRNA pseudouridine55 synthase
MSRKFSKSVDRQTPLSGAMMNGFLVIDKPGGMTSRYVVNRVQKWFPRRTKIGHTGTLDPLATGVLVVCVGAATRLADYVQAMCKTYTSRFRLGVDSTTDDADGEVASRPIEAQPSRGEIETALASFIGTVEQVPPHYSALKVSGQRAHELARKGDEIQLAARRVCIDAIRVGDYGWPFVDVEVDCGKGTYIRSIARDLGAKLGCGGMVQTLRRTRIGPFMASQSIGLDVEPRTVKLLPLISAVSELPRVHLDAENEKRFRSGQSIPEPIHETSQTGEIAILNEHDELIGIAGCAGEKIQPLVVLNL